MPGSARGNIAGVAIALHLGGPGAIFWMWVIGILGMSTSVIECTLAQLFKVSNHDGTFRGGPAYYIEQGLGKRWLGLIFATFLILCFGFAFNAVQANTITAAMDAAFGYDHITVGLLIVLSSALIIFGGLQRIAYFSEILVPIMALFYITTAIVITAINSDQLPRIFHLVISHAFGLHEAASGGIAYTISQALSQGIRRGLFSNEAGMGSAPNAAAIADPRHPAAQGLVQMLGVFFSTIIICSATASFLLLSDVLYTQPNDTGVTLTQLALQEHIGSWGSIFIAIISLCFAFSSIIANYYYSETNLFYMCSRNKYTLLLFRTLVLIVIAFGSIASLKLVWNLADILMGFMAMINLLAILLLSKLAITVIKDYQIQHRKKKIPFFSNTSIPILTDKLDTHTWTITSIKPEKNT